MTLPSASLSLDLDNQWSYMKTHGDPGWETFPSYLDVVVPRFLDVVAELNLRMTVFVVGQDAAIDSNHTALRSIHTAGHEIGNHSFHHEPWLHLYTPEQVDAEIARAEIAIEQATGQRPVGFRGPGFSLSPTVLSVLAARGYEYDCSVFPTFLGPLARAYYFFTAKLSKAEREQRKQLFGSWTEGFRPLAPYQWQIGERHLLEIPVTTMPLFRVPIHVSYLLYLWQYSSAAAWAYWKLALKLCYWRGIGLSLLLHPLDFLGGDDVPCLGFFPAMKAGGQAKTAFLREILAEFQRHFQVLTMREHATQLATSAKLRVIKSELVAIPTAGETTTLTPTTSAVT
jgi:peptidoglycan-N-acetylglucosamine deacetylase